MRKDMVMEMRSCVRCEQEIPEERVKVLPNTRVCVDCSQEIGGEVVMVVTPTQIGKPGSLKRLTGGVDVQFVPKEIPPLGVRGWGTRRRRK